MQEIFKDIPWYEGIYQVSNAWNFKYIDTYYWRKRNHIRLSSQTTYANIVLKKWNHTKYALLHRIIAEIFIPNPENKPQINHKNFKEGDNRVENLEWCTASENIQHMWNRRKWCSI
jgi:hypothetical protein